MTAGNNGAGNGSGASGAPENDDPFGYLYRSEGGSTEGGQNQAAAYQPGVPRTSYNQVRPVGSRTYGGTQGVGSNLGAAAQRPGGPNPHYAAPETLPGGMPAQSGGRAQGTHGGHGTPPARPKRRGLLIAAIAVVLVVAGGIGVAMLTNSSSDDKQTTAGGEEKPGGDEQDKGDDAKKKKEKDKDEKPKNPSVNSQTKRDASNLRLSGGATTEKTVKGAQADGGIYITGMNQPGAAVEWTVDVEKAGEYRLNLRYGVPGKDATLTTWANGNKTFSTIKMKNYGAKPGDWENGWFTSWVQVTLNKGTNTLKFSCEPGNECESHLDQVWIS
ncbi:CBM35 domain-containing protein [Streptomyces sp. UNOB3_S3]|uniref:CBM35 domain-containing protein n=1 Tax=Streptomyces sp. UNOB3_S3 TaxID=2871682 RepID=UPI001E3840BE|nr:CBM35 domain-containing protein [Streptomyces sp. UNOB3_S3]MCC3774979.1 carbohydrate-binding protein [Streptomyces sp. UNOB3_S3]